MAKGIDWISIKNEYINTNISQRKLAEKYGVSFNTLKIRANKEKWAYDREKAHNVIAEKIQQKTSEIIAQAEVDRLTKILNTGDKIQSKIDEALEQLNIHVDMFGKEHESTVIDVGRLRKLMATLKDLSDVISNAEAGDKEISKLDKLIEGITDAAKS